MTDTIDEAIEQYSSDDSFEQEIAEEVTEPNDTIADEPDKSLVESPLETTAAHEVVAPENDDDIIASHLNEIRAQDSFAPIAEPIETASVEKSHTARNVILIIFAILLVIAAGLVGWVYYIEKQAEGIVPAGVSYANNQSLAGMKEPEVSETIANAAKQLLENNIVVSLSSESADAIEANTVSKPLSAFVTIDAQKMTKAAVDVRQQAPLLTRLQVDILKKTTDKNIPFAYTIDESAVSAFAKEIAKASNTSARDAEIKQVGGKIDIEDGASGFTADKKKLKSDIKAAIKDTLANSQASQSLNISLTGKTVEPKKTTESLQSTPAIIVKLSQRSVTLYNGEKVVKTYRCAIGTPDHPTPVGNWKIVLKRKNPTWVNPGSEWAKDMPKTIGPGPTNPLGMRALNLNASGIRLHGTTSLGSIGTAASHGCMRMRNEDIIDLFDRVEVGTPVFIIQ